MFAINRHAPILDCCLTLTIHSGLATSPRRGLPAWSLGCRGHRHVTRGGQQSRHGLYRRRASQRSTPPSICCKQSGVINFPLSTLPNCCVCNKSTTNPQQVHNRSITIRMLKTNPRHVNVLNANDINKSARKSINQLIDQSINRSIF